MNGLQCAVVIGTSGQVAGALVALLKSRGTEVISTSSSGAAQSQVLDLGKPESIAIFFRFLDEKFQGQFLEVFLPGALTHVDRCETERDLCLRLNEIGPALVAQECARRGHKLTFFSTEYVYGEAEYHGGAVGPFSESDPPAPSSYYGQCKLEAEKKILSILGPERALVIRTTMVYSWAPNGMNFLMQYLKQLHEIESGLSPPVFRIPEDQISTPTYAPALAEATVALREKGVGGIVNVVGSDCLSRRAVVEQVIRTFGYNREKSLSGFRFLKTAELAQKARRPLTAGLTCDKLRGLGMRVLSLEEGLSAALALQAKEKAGIR